MTDPNGNPIDTVQAGSSMWVGMNVTSTQGSQISIYATTTVYDASMVPIATNFWTSTMNAEQTVGSRFQMQVPSSASSGRAVIVGCVYSKEPAIGGIAYCPQSTLYYYLSGTQTGLLGITQPSSQPQTTAGVYTDSITLPPNPIQGKYSVYVLGQSGPVTISSATTSFTVQTTTGFPPQASFVYDPPNPVTSQTVSFDASSSSPGGYNDIITGYNWNFGDGTPGYASASSSTASHAYTQTGTYTVTLNVTNNEGLWCTTSKPITVSPVYGPTANFTWSPQNVTANSAITFDASNSKPGSLSTLTDYIWNFSDGTGLYDVPTLQEGHVFTKPGSYTVTLKVVDSQGRSASTSALLQVQNATWKLGDVNHDGKIDGRDITIVAKAFGSHGPNFDYPGEPASPNWNPIADLNGDNKVDGRDITIVAKKFGTDPP
jgi:PKD repeat protein